MLTYVILPFLYHAKIADNPANIWMTPPVIEKTPWGSKGSSPIYKIKYTVNYNPETRCQDLDPLFCTSFSYVDIVAANMTTIIFQYLTASIFE